VRRRELVSKVNQNVYSCSKIHRKLFLATTTTTIDPFDPKFDPFDTKFDPFDTKFDPKLFLNLARATLEKTSIL
jgi:hypothetical protein